MDAATNASTIVPSGGGSTTLYVAVSLVIVLFTAGVILVAVVLALAVRRKRSRARKGKYNLIPTVESCEDGKVKPALPFPPTVSLNDPPMTDGMMFTLAPQLSTFNQYERGNMRYPFVQHRIPGPQASLEERRPPRLRTRRKGNHKHGRAIRGVRHRVRNSDTNGDSPNGDSPPLPQVYLLPAQNQLDDKDPEVFLTLLYSKMSASLVVRVERVVGLPLRQDGTEVNAYVQLHLTPVRPAGPQRRSSKTHTERRNSAPVFEEEIRFEAMSEVELKLSTLHVEVLDYKVYGKHQLLGGTMLALSAIHFLDGEAKISLPLITPQVQYNYELRDNNMLFEFAHLIQRNGMYSGVVLLSLCYDHPSDKLTLIVLRAKDLNGGKSKETDIVAKLCVQVRDKTIAKLKTKKKPGSSSPIFNEALSCSVDPKLLREVKVVVTLLNEHRSARKKEVGSIVLGSAAFGDNLRHWNDALAAGGKHIAEWHELN